MDHLPLPLEAHDQIRCKYIPNTYGPLVDKMCSFFEFDRQSGFRFFKVLRGNFENGLRPEHLEGFFQAWLYFSFLYEILGSSVNTQDFVRHDPTDGNDYLSTCHLDDYIRKWHEQYYAATQPTKQGMRNDIISATQGVTYVLNRMLNAVESDSSPVRLISHEFELAARVLIQTLEFKLLPDDLPRQRVVDDSGTHICPLLTQRLLDNRWCPNQINMLACTMDVPSLYYASLLGPDTSDKDHFACTDDLCKANQIDQSLYNTAHVLEDCQCEFVGASSRELADIIQDEQIPVIDMASNGAIAERNIRIRTLQEGMKYVALSHVWADGLGNPIADSLPMCQLTRLSEYVKVVLPDHRFLWCDTLCVPKKPPQLRRKAIWKMRDIYEKAYVVLILDASLRSASLSCSAEELMMRVTCSGWMRRLWTFQENILAKKLRVVLRDGIANINNAASKIYTQHPGQPITAACYHHSIGLEASVFYRTVIPAEERLLKEPDIPQGVSIGSVWESLQWRTTSWLSDEPICLAVALAIDLPLVLDTAEDQRMKKIFSLTKGWPPYLIFAEYERFPEPGWKWAPRTLMHPKSMSTPKLHHMNYTTCWHKEGLIVEFPGFVTDLGQSRNMNVADQNPRINLNMTFFLKDRSTGAWYDCFRNDQRIESFDESYLTIRGLMKPAVILSCPVEGLSPADKATPQLWDGLLVDVKKHEDDILFCDYVVKVLVGLSPPKTRAEIEEEFVKMEQGSEPADTSEPQSVALALSDVQSDRQRWCVG
jgi:hypothetical protein